MNRLSDIYGTSLALLTDLYGAWFGTTGLGDMARQCTGYRYYSTAAGFAVIGGDSGSSFKGAPIRCLASGSYQDHVTAWHAAHVKPPIVGTGDFQAEAVVVPGPLAYQKDHAQYA